MNYNKWKTEYLRRLREESHPDWEGDPEDFEFTIGESAYPDFYKRYINESKNPLNMANYGNRNNYGKRSGNSYGNYSGSRAAAPVKKHSGAKFKKYFPTSGPNKGVEQKLVTGWRLANRQLISFHCVTTSKSKLSDKGWIGSVACSVTNTATGQKSFYWGTMQAATGKVVIGDLALVLNPKGGKGGYCGTFLNK